MITGRNAGHRPKIWSKITNFIALRDYQNRLNLALSSQISFRLIFSLELFQQQISFALEMITGRNARRKPKTWSKMTNFIALWDFQTG